MGFFFLFGVLKIYSCLLFLKKTNFIHTYPSFCPSPSPRGPFLANKRGLYSGPQLPCLLWAPQTMCLCSSLPAAQCGGSHPSRARRDPGPLSRCGAGVLQLACSRHVDAPVLWAPERRANSLEKTLVLGRIEGRRRRGRRRMRWLDGISDSVDMRAWSVASVMSDSVTPWTAACQSPLPMGCSRQDWETVEDRKAWCATVLGLTKRRAPLSD